MLINCLCLLKRLPLKLCKQVKGLGAVILGCIFRETLCDTRLYFAFILVTVKVLSRSAG